MQKLIKSESRHRDYLYFIKGKTVPKGVTKMDKSTKKESLTSRPERRDPHALYYVKGQVIPRGVYKTRRK